MSRVTIVPDHVRGFEASVSSGFNLPAREEYHQQDEEKRKKAIFHTMAILCYLVAGGEAVKRKFPDCDNVGDGSDMDRFYEIVDGMHPVPGADEVHLVARRVELLRNARDTVRRFYGSEGVWETVEMVAARLVKDSTVEGEDFVDLQNDIRDALGMKT